MVTKRKGEIAGEEGCMCCLCLLLHSRLISLGTQMFFEKDFFVYLIRVCESLLP